MIISPYKMQTEKSCQVYEYSMITSKSELRHFRIISELLKEVNNNWSKQRWGLTLEGEEDRSLLDGDEREEWP